MHKTARQLNTILNNHLHLDKRYNTIISNTLANELVNLKIDSQHRLLTLDIKDLYVNIHIQETLNLTRTQLSAHNDKQTTHQIMTLLNTILRQNYFFFLGQIYQPDKGVAMGSPISGTMTEIFLQLENSTSSSTSLTPRSYPTLDTWTTSYSSITPLAPTQTISYIR